MSIEKSHKGTLIIDRLKQALEVKYDTDLADKMGIDRTVVANWKRRDSVNADVIISKCHHLDLNYIFTGVPLRHTDTKVDSIQKASIPFYRSVRPSGGDGLIPEQEDDIIYIGVPRSFVHQELRSSLADLFVMRMIGESMQPTIQEHDYIIVSKHVARPFAGRVYLIRIDDALLCKRIHEKPDRKLQIMSDNDRYDDFLIDREDQSFKILGRVVWFGRNI